MRSTISQLKDLLCEALKSGNASLPVDAALDIIERMFDIGAMGVDEKNPPLRFDVIAPCVTVRSYERLYTIWWMNQDTEIQSLDAEFDSRSLVRATTDVASISELMEFGGVGHEDSVVTTYSGEGFDPCEFIERVMSENPGHPEGAFLNDSLRNFREEKTVIVTKRTSSQQKVRANDKF